MNKFEMFEPALCKCSQIEDENQFFITPVVDALNTIEGYEAYEYNLRDHLIEFAENKTISAILQETNTDALPITVMNGEVKKIGAFPTLEEIAEYTGIHFQVTGTSDETPVVALDAARERTNNI